MKTNLIVLLFYFNLIIFFVSGCDYAPALIQPSEEATFQEANEEETSKNISEDNSSQVTQDNRIIYVHVCGAVKNPGLYELPAGSRADAAVKAAGGMTKDAEESQINLAQILEDGMQLYVPTEDEVGEGLTGVQNQAKTGAEAANENASSQININTATIEELMTLSGIGESKAKAIIEYRETNGLFSTIEDVKNVSGIGDGIFEKIKDYITV